MTRCIEFSITPLPLVVHRDHAASARFEYLLMYSFRSLSGDVEYACEYYSSFREAQDRAKWL